MKIVYVYDKYNPTNTGYVKGLWRDDANNLYYAVNFPRQGDTQYININELQSDETGRMYYEGDNGDINKIFITFCKQHAGCTGCKYEQYDNCKERFIKDQEV